MSERLFADSERPEPTAHPRILKLQRRTLINGRINSVLESLQPIRYHDPARAARSARRVLREVLHQVIPTVGPFDDEPEVRAWARTRAALICATRHPSPSPCPSIGSEEEAGVIAVLRSG